MNRGTVESLNREKLDFQFPFEKLEVWNLAKDLARDIYKLTDQFPTHEKFGLISQLNRAGISVASTIAEGSSRSSRKDQAHFSQIAYGSLMEVACQLVIACDLEYISSEQKQTFRQKIEKLANKLNALHKYQTQSHRFNGSTIQRFNKRSF